ncbi:hypothetical protein HDU97_005313 [Phlyctochytrium planicorne]|nr:hypothetical protein HDU97_005313 [Phlyctochytrium planicorne]
MEGYVRERPVRAVAPVAYVSRPSYSAAQTVERDPYADIPFWMPTTRWEKKWVQSSANSMNVFGQKPSTHKALILKWVPAPGKKPENFEEDEVPEDEIPVDEVQEIQEDELVPDAGVEITVTSPEKPTAEEAQPEEKPTENKAEEKAELIKKMHLSNLRVESLRTGNPDAATPPNSAVPRSPGSQAAQTSFPFLSDKLTEKLEKESQKTENEMETDP